MRYQGKGNDIDTLLEDIAYGYGLSIIKVAAKKDIKRVEIGSFTVEETRQGSEIEIPRWVAEVLDKQDLVTYPDDGMELEVFKAINREKIQGPIHLTSMRSDMYPKIRSLLKNDLRENRTPDELQEHQKLSMSTRNLVTIRIRKLLSLAALPSTPDEITKKITPEEELLFDHVRGVVDQWRTLVLGDDRA